MRSDRIVVVGASMGGVPALRTLASRLPADFPAPLLVVLHVGNFPSILPELMAARSALPVGHAVDGEQLRPGRIYIAPPDHHMLVEGDAIRLNRGPKEHHSRPAIDPLFVSAALAHGAGVIGVVLTGMLDDGTAGLQAIKRCGGTAIVQDPDEAEAPSMPLSALRHVQVDHRAFVADIGNLLSRAVRLPHRAAAGMPRDLVHEFELTLAKGDPMEHLKEIGHPSTFACPDCSGALWQLDATDPVRYRCHTGHGFSMRSLLSALSEATDTALWSAVRAVQEECLLLTEMAATKRAESDEENARQLEAAAGVAKQRVAALRRIVESVPSPGAQDVVAPYRESPAAND